MKDTIEKEDYLTMPMSALYLFDRSQDYGFAHAEPVRVVMSRNHLRIWKSPYEVNGKPLWCVAATHDIGFERDQRNNGITHKIDSAIDGEREYVNETLSGTGLVVARKHVTPPNPLTEAKCRRQLSLRRPDSGAGSEQPIGKRSSEDEVAARLADHGAILMCGRASSQ